MTQTETYAHNADGVTPAILRRIEVDERDAAILCAVWHGARTYRGIARWTGCSIGGLVYRVAGHDGRMNRVGGGLIERGYLCGPLNGDSGVIRPGPRLVGLHRIRDEEWPLELAK